MQCFSNACKLKGVHFMTKIGKRIIIIAIPVAVSARFAVIICLFCGKIQYLQLFFFVPCIFRDYKRFGECDRDRRRKNYNVSACGFC